MFNNDRVSNTFWMDFSIADKFGANAIRDTFRRAFREWKRDYKMLTELVMVLNHKCWAFHETNQQYCELYAELYYKAHDYALDNLKGNELKHYLSVTD